MVMKVIFLSAYTMVIPVAIYLTVLLNNYNNPSGGPIEKVLDISWLVVLYTVVKGLLHLIFTRTWLPKASKGAYDLETEKSGRGLWVMESDVILYVVGVDAVSFEQLCEIVVPQDGDPMLYEDYELALKQVEQLNELLEQTVEVASAYRYWLRYWGEDD